MPFNIQTDEQHFQFILRLNDIRSHDYTAEYTDKDGRHKLPKGEIFTYKATLIGEKNSIVALTVDGTKTEGYLATEYEGFFIESAKKYSSHAKDDDKVIYKVKDKVEKDDGICGLDEAVESGMKSVSSDTDFKTVSTAPNGRRVLEVATEADKDFVEEFEIANGNPAVANAHILSVMNQVDAVYERQLNLSVEITFQHAWAPGTPDPYAGLIDDPLLLAFRNYWNATFPSSNPTFRRDVGHMFTDKIDTHGGLAYESTVCRYLGDLSYSYTSSIRSDKWINTAHELGHNLGAKHTDESPVQPACAGTIMQGIVFPLGATGFCPYSVNQITSHVAAYGTCLHSEVASTTRTLFDFDGDGEADLSLFRPSNTYWYLQQSMAGFYSTPFGLATDKLAPADYDGEGKADIAVFRNGTWYLQQSRDGLLVVGGFGLSGDIPVPADFTGDGKADLALFRPSTGVWYTQDLTNNQSTSYLLGQTGDKPVIGDFDGDGKADYAVYRPSNGTWYLQQSTQGSSTVQFGNSTDKPIPADFTGDGKTDIAVFRPSTAEWFIMRSENNSFYSLPFGATGDIPSPADYDGDGKADVCVFRNGTWIRTNSSNNATIYITFGVSGDIPIPAFNIVP